MRNPEHKPRGAGEAADPDEPDDKMWKNRREARAAPQRPERWARSAGPGLTQPTWGQASREGEEGTVQRGRGLEKHREAPSTAQDVFKNPCL